MKRLIVCATALLALAGCVSAPTVVKVNPKSSVTVDHVSTINSLIAQSNYAAAVDACEVAVNDADSDVVEKARARDAAESMIVNRLLVLNRPVAIKCARIAQQNPNIKADRLVSMYVAELNFISLEKDYAKLINRVVDIHLDQRLWGVLVFNDNSFASRFVPVAIDAMRKAGTQSDVIACYNRIKRIPKGDVKEQTIGMFTYYAADVMLGEKKYGDALSILDKALVLPAVASDAASFNRLLILKSRVMLADSNNYARAVTTLDVHFTSPAVTNSETRVWIANTKIKALSSLGTLHKGGIASAVVTDKWINMQAKDALLRSIMTSLDASTNPSPMLAVFNEIKSIKDCPSWAVGMAHYMKCQWFINPNHSDPAAGAKALEDAATDPSMPIGMLSGYVVHVLPRLWVDRKLNEANAVSMRIVSNTNVLSQPCLQMAYGYAFSSLYAVMQRDAAEDVVRKALFSDNRLGDSVKVNIATRAASFPKEWLNDVEPKRLLNLADIMDKSALRGVKDAAILARANAYYMMGDSAKAVAATDEFSARRDVGTDVDKQVKKVRMESMTASGNYDGAIAMADVVLKAKATATISAEELSNAYLVKMSALRGAKRNAELVIVARAAIADPKVDQDTKDKATLYLATAQYSSGK